MATTHFLGNKTSYKECLKKKKFLCYPSPKATGEYKIQQFLERFLQTNSSSIAWELARDAGSSGCAPDLLNESPLRWPRYLGFNEPVEAVVQTHPCPPRSGLSSHHSLRHPVPQPPSGPASPSSGLLCLCSHKSACFAPALGGGLPNPLCQRNF